MKFLPAFILLLLGGCGKYKFIEAETLVGKQVPIETMTTFSGLDRSDIRAVCNALDAKEKLLSPATAAGSHQFSVLEKECNLTERTFFANVTIDSENEVFKNTGTEIFPFANIETTRRGVLKGICADSDFDGMHLSEGRVTVVRSGGHGLSSCPVVSGEVCLKILQGPSDGANINVQSEELIRFRVNTNQKNVGFFTYRKLFVKGLSCEENESRKIEATLQN